MLCLTDDVVTVTVSDLTEFGVSAYDVSSGAFTWTPNYVPGSASAPSLT